MERTEERTETEAEAALGRMEAEFRRMNRKARTMAAMLYRKTWGNGKAPKPHKAMGAWRYGQALAFSRRHLTPELLVSLLTA